jgi:fructose transport system permease protein
MSDDPTPGGPDFEARLKDSTAAVAEFEHAPRGMLGTIQHVLHANPTFVPVIVLVVSIAVFGVIAGERFFSPFNLSLIMQQVSINGILAAAQTLIILTAGIDLSIAAIMVLISVISGKLSVELGVPAPIALVIGFVCGMGAGYRNGWLVTRIKLPPFIATLGTWNVFFALNLYLSGAQSIRGSDIDEMAPLLKFFGQSIAIGSARLTYGMLLMIAIFIELWYVLNKTA